ncbi:MAG: SsrA-binding protein SmpB [Erysipelotrichaceae bacterium]|jgi:SsrA-binding protein|nr:SsrA-binding protein SmpB [Erysipelotrichaceae bacterium]
MEFKDHKKIIATNKKAHFEYFLSDALECGIELRGTEIKSLRENGASLNDAYVIFKAHEAYLLNMHISEYKHGNIFNHEPLRTRKLLMHKLEINKYSKKIEVVGYTIVATKLYFKNGRVKVEISLAKGKKLYDKREVIKKRDLDREAKGNQD